MAVVALVGEAAAIVLLLECSTIIRRGNCRLGCGQARVVAHSCPANDLTLRLRRYRSSALDFLPQASMSKNIRDKGYEFLHTVTRVSISYGPASGIAASGLVKMLYLEKLLQAHVFMIGSCSPGPRAEISGRAPLHSIWCCATTYKVTFINPVRSIRRSSALQRSGSTLKQTQAAAGFADNIYPSCISEAAPLLCHDARRLK